MTWMTNAGELIELSRMSGEHVAACITLIVGGGLHPNSETCSFTKFEPGELRRVFETELVRRARRRS
jgi:hypothetical protein